MDMVAAAASPPVEGSWAPLRPLALKAKNAPPPITSDPSNKRKGMPLALNIGFDPAPVPGNGKDALSLVEVNDAVADRPIIPCAAADCADVEAGPAPDAVADAVWVSVMAAVFVGGGVREGLGVEVGNPGGTVSVGTSVSVGVGVGVNVGVGVRVDVGVGVGVKVGVGVEVDVGVGVKVGVGVDVGVRVGVLVGVRVDVDVQVGVSV